MPVMFSTRWSMSKPFLERQVVFHSLTLFYFSYLAQGNTYGCVFFKVLLFEKQFVEILKWSVRYSRNSISCTGSYKVIACLQVISLSYCLSPVI